MTFNGLTLLLKLCSYDHELPARKYETNTVSMIALHEVTAGDLERE
jgi:hypothetical protein